RGPGGGRRRAAVARPPQRAPLGRPRPPRPPPSRGVWRHRPAVSEMPITRVDLTWTCPTSPTLERCDPESGQSAGANDALSCSRPGTKFAGATPMMIRGSAFLCVAVLSAQGSQAPDLGRVKDAKSWRVIDADAAVEGPVVRLKPHGDPAVGSHIGLALVQNVKFSEGTLEIDLRGGGKQKRVSSAWRSPSRTSRLSRRCTFVRSDSRTTTRTRAVTRPARRVA